MGQRPLVFIALLTLSGCGAGESEDEPATACVFQGLYEMGWSLAYGTTDTVELPPDGSGEPGTLTFDCSPGGEVGVAQLQTTSESACSASACATFTTGNRNQVCFDFTCDRASPVVACQSLEDRGNCGFNWFLYPEGEPPAEIEALGY